MPGHRSLSFTDVSRCACPGQAVNPAPLYRVPFGSVFSYAISTPIIGMATGAYDAHVAYQRDRVRAAYIGQKAAEDPFGQVRVAEAAAELDGAWLALERNMSELMARARAGDKIPLSLRLRVRRDQVPAPARRSGRWTCCSRTRAGGRCGPARRSSGSGATRTPGRVHAINDPERALSMFGRGEFGLDVRPDAMV